MPVGALSGYAAGDAGADAFVADILNAADSQLVGLWLCHNSDTYRSMGTGVAYLIDQVTGAVGARLNQSTGSAQPSIDSSGPNGRDRCVFAAASNQYLATTGLYSTASGERWGLVSVQAFTTSVDAFRSALNLIDLPSGGGAYVLCGRTNTGDTNFTGTAVSTTGVDTSESDVAIDTGWHSHDFFVSDPHAITVDGSAGTSGGSDPVGSRADSGNGQVVMGANQPVSGYVDVATGLAMLVKLSGSSVPGWMPAVREYIDTYYGGLG